MDKDQARELKRYTRELLRDYDELAQNLAEAERVAEERAIELQRLQDINPQQETNSEMFEELVRTRERAMQAEIEARRLKVMLAMATELRGVDVARTRAACSRALAFALENLKRRAAGGPPPSSTKPVVVEESHQLVGCVEAAAAEAALVWRRRRRPLRNGDGSARRLVLAVENVLSHGHAKQGEFVLEAAAATAVAAAKRPTPGARDEAVLLSVARAKQAKVPRWLAKLGWTRGRLALFELLNRGVCAFALEALCLEDGRSAGPAVAHYSHGAPLLDVQSASRVVKALDRLERIEKTGFALIHAHERANTLNEPFVTTPTSRAEEDDDVPVDDVPSAPVLAALRRRGARSAASLALEGSAWRRARVDPARPTWWRPPDGRPRTGYADRRVRLRDGPEDHVICWQWQSRSQKLRWTLDTAGKTEEPENRAAPPRSPVKDDSSLSDEAPTEDARWGGDLAQPEDLDDDDDDTVATGARILIDDVPEIFYAAECVAGAEKDIGPVHEAWAAPVPANANVRLRCELVASRPLVRARSARFRVVALRVSHFFEVLVPAAAATAELAVWGFAEETGVAPRDAADFAARAQLADANARRLFLDVQHQLPRSSRVVLGHRRPRPVIAAFDNHPDGDDEEEDDDDTPAKDDDDAATTLSSFKDDSDGSTAPPRPVFVF